MGNFIKLPFFNCFTLFCNIIEYRSEKTKTILDRQSSALVLLKLFLVIDANCNILLV